MNTVDRCRAERTEGEHIPVDEGGGLVDEQKLGDSAASVGEGKAPSSEIPHDRASCIVLD